MLSGMNSSNFEAETKEPKRRKVMAKSVISVKIEPSEGKKKSKGAPDDNWSWRKYGQKPIKGSPHPRGYYRCSTSKGCTAKKQVERCKYDASKLIITYTSTHNHATPKETPSSTKDLQRTETNPVIDQSAPPSQEQKNEDGNGNENENENHFRYCQSLFESTTDTMSNHKEDPFAESIEDSYGSLGVLVDEEPLSYPLPLMTFQETKTEEYDFFDELEDLPMSSIFKSFMKKDLFDERILVHPS